MSRKVTPTYTLLNQATLAATSADVTFSNIPQNYGDLIVVVRSSATSAHEVHLRVNGNSSNIYSNTSIRATVNSPFQEAFAFTSTEVRLSNSTTSTDFTTIAQLFDYSQIDKHKSMIIRSGYFQNEENGRFLEASAVRWASTDAITSIRVLASTSTFAIGSAFSLYGIAA